MEVKSIEIPTSRLLRKARLQPALGLEHDRDRQGPCQGRPRLDLAHEHDREEQQRLAEQRSDPRAARPDQLMRAA